VPRSNACGRGHREPGRNSGGERFQSGKRERSDIYDRAIDAAQCKGVRGRGGLMKRGRVQILLINQKGREHAIKLCTKKKKQKGWDDT